MSSQAYHINTAIMQHCPPLPGPQAPQLWDVLLHPVATCIAEYIAELTICHEAQGPGCNLLAPILAASHLRVGPHTSSHTAEGPCAGSKFCRAWQLDGPANRCIALPVAHSYKVAPKLYMSAAGVGSISALNNSGATYLPSPSSQSCSNVETVRGQVRYNVHILLQIWDQWLNQKAVP